MKFSNARHQSVLRTFNLLVRTDAVSRNDRDITLAQIQQMSRELNVELRGKESELELGPFLVENQFVLQSSIKRLKKEIAQTTEMQ